MEDFIQFSAKTKSEAITKACIELGVSSDQLEIQVVSEGKSGLFGIGSKPAIIKVRKTEPVSEEEEIKEIVETVKIDSLKEEKAIKEEISVKEEKKPEQVKKAPKDAKKEVKEPKAAAPKQDKPRQPKPVKERKEKISKEPKETVEKPAKEKAVKTGKPVEIITDPEEIKEVEDRARVFLHDVFASMNLGEVEITSKYNTADGSLEVDFEGEDMGILIGKRGQTLDSLQYLTSLVVNKGKANYIRVKLDTEDYRKETLENLARGIAYKVKKTRKTVVLEPMNPYERRIIHSALQGNKFVETVSEGEEPYRHVVVKLKRN